MGKVIAVDGKSLRGTARDGEANSFVHMVSAWAAESGLTLGQRKVDGKSNEITAIPALLELIDIEGTVVSIDAMGTQTAIAELIIKQEADYLLALKENHPTLYWEVENYFNQALVYGNEGLDYHLFEEEDSGHGRKEARRVYVAKEVDFLGELKRQWRGLQTIVCVESERMLSGNATTSRRYYITSLPPDPEFLGESIRSHWGIENKVHWILDVALREDAQKARLGHIAANMALVRRMALNLLSSEKSTRRGIATKRLKAAWSKDYLLKVLTVKSSS